jgi:hypothetical protein
MASPQGTSLDLLRFSNSDGSESTRYYHMMNLQTSPSASPGYQQAESNTPSHPQRHRPAPLTLAIFTYQPQPFENVATPTRRASQSDSAYDLRCARICLLRKLSPTNPLRNRTNFDGSLKH